MNYNILTLCTLCDLPLCALWLMDFIFWMKATPRINITTFG